MQEYSRQDIAAPDVGSTVRNTASVTSSRCRPTRLAPRDHECSAGQAGFVRSIRSVKGRHSPLLCLLDRQYPRAYSGVSGFLKYPSPYIRLPFPTCWWSTVCNIFCFTISLEICTVRYTDRPRYLSGHSVSSTFISSIYFRVLTGCGVSQQLEFNSPTTILRILHNASTHERR